MVKRRLRSIVGAAAAILIVTGVAAGAGAQEPPATRGGPPLGDRISDDLGLPRTGAGPAVRPEVLVSISTRALDGAIAPGGTGRLAVEVAIAPGWHLNTAGKTLEFLVPTRLLLAPPDGLSVGEVVPPATVRRRFAFVDQEIDLLEGTAVFTAVLEAAADVAPGERTIRGRLEYQACNDAVCLLPARKDFTATIEIGGRPRGGTGGTDAAAGAAPVPAATEIGAAPAPEAPAAPGEAGRTGLAAALAAGSTLAAAAVFLIARRRS